MPKTEEGLSYQYEKGVLTFRTCPNPITSLNIAQIDAGGPIREIRVVFDAHGASGGRFFAAQELVLPETLQVFPKFEAAFSKVSQLHLPQSCQKFPVKAFEGWKKLKEISIPEGVTELPDGIFSGCSSLQCVHMPDSVSSFGKEAFRNCNKLPGKLILPKGLAKIGDQAFSGCKNIEEIIFPDGLASIGTKAFKGCAKLRQGELSAGVQFQKDSFPDGLRVRIDGVEQAVESEKFYAKLSSVFLRDVDVHQIRGSLQNEQNVEVHAIIHRFAKRLEVMTIDGSHIGFLADSSIKAVKKLKKIQLGQAFDASIAVMDDSEITVSFMNDVTFRPTSFPERTYCFDWNLPAIECDQLPLENSVFQFRLKTEPYKLLCERDSLLQRSEYAKAFSEDSARIIYRKESESKYLYARSNEEISVFWPQHISMTLLEHIPIGTEFDVKIESICIQVDDDSWGAMHAGGMADYAYSVPAIVFFWRGIRVAYAPLLGSSCDWNAALFVFWKWSQHTEWTPKAWFVQITDASTCVFQLAFFPGAEQITGSIDLSSAMEYVGEKGEKVPLKNIFSFFEKADKICLCASEAGSDGIALQQGESFFRLPVGMYELREFTEYENNHIRNNSWYRWYTMEELEKLTCSKQDF